MARQIINSGSPPLVWSDIDNAFEKINSNFAELYLSVGGSAVDLTALATNISPVDTEVYDLGSPTKRWRDIYLSSSSIYLGDARITASGNVINLPAGSTIGSDPLELNYFQTIAVAGQPNVVADNRTDTLNLVGTTGLTITTDPLTDSITFNNSGVTGLTTGDGIGINAPNGNVQITNTGVLSLSNGLGISVSGATGSITIGNTGVLQLTAGNGIILSANTGNIQITNSQPNIVQNTFKFVRISNQSGLIEANSGSDTLFFAPGRGLNMSVSPLTDTVNLAVDTNLDIRGSVYADDSTLLVDGTNGRIVGPVFANVTGNLTGNVTGNADSATVASTVNITNTNGLTTTYYLTFAENRTTGQTLRGDADLYYRTDTNTLTAGTFSGTLSGNLFTTLIDSADSSAINVTPAIIFNSDATVENNLTVTKNINSLSVSSTEVSSPLFNTQTTMDIKSGTSIRFTTDNKIWSLGNTGLTLPTTGDIRSSGSVNLIAPTISLSGTLAITGAIKQTVQNIAGLSTGGVILTAEEIVGNILTGEPLLNNRDLTIPNAGSTVAGLRLTIRNRSASYTITLKTAAGTTISTIGTTSNIEVACDGFSWFVV